MKASIVLILWLCKIGIICGQPEKAVFDYTRILFDIPGDALPLSNEERLRTFNAFYNPRYYSYYKEVEIPFPDDTTVETHQSQFNMRGSLSEREGYIFEFKIYLVPRDTFLLTIYRPYEIFEVDQDTLQKLRVKPMIVRAYKLRGLKNFEEIPLPTIKPTDYAKTPNDSLIISNMQKSADLDFSAFFESSHSHKKGIYFVLRDLTLNTGPFEPPITRPPKYFSDYETIEKQICFLVTQNGIVYEN